MAEQTAPVEPVEPFEFVAKSPIHLHQTVWVIRKYKIKVEIGVCLCCGGDGTIRGLDQETYPCPRKIENNFSLLKKDCDDGTTTQMSMEWGVHDGKVESVNVEIEDWGKKELRQRFSYRVSWGHSLLPSGDWGHVKLEEIGYDLGDQIYTTKEEADEICTHLKERDDKDDGV